MTDRLVVAPAPVFEIDGAVAGSIARDVQRLDVAHDVSGLKTFVGYFLGDAADAAAPIGELPLLGGDHFDFGKELGVAIGPAGEQRNMFKGLVSGLEARFTEAGLPVVVVYAEDELMKLRMTRRNRTYTDVSDADIAEEIAGEHGLAASTTADGPTYAVVQQLNQTDLAFLRERAALIQAELWMEDGTLNFATRENRFGTELTLVQGNQLLDVKARADLAHQRSVVHVAGYDATSREVIDEEADVAVVQAEVSGGRLGPDVLEQALGERVTSRVREAPLDATEAAAWARAEMLRRSRRFVTVTGTTSGSPDMIVGSRLTLERVGAPFAGAGYYVTFVRHTFDLESGYRTHFQAERASLAAA